jgi:hypothetical protein
MIAITSMSAGRHWQRTERSNGSNVQLLFLALHYNLRLMKRTSTTRYGGEPEMPVPYQYPVEQWARRKLRTQADVELAADIQRRAQSCVRGWDEETLESNQLKERRGRTYMGQAMADDLDLGGRYAKVHTTTVIGNSPVSYPQLPADSPWARNELPDEPPLGLAIDEQEAVGEPHEIAASQSATPASDIGLHTGVVAAPPPPSEQEFSLVTPADLAAGGGGRRKFVRRA